MTKIKEINKCYSIIIEKDYKVSEKLTIRSILIIQRKLGRFVKVEVILLYLDEGCYDETLEIAFHIYPFYRKWLVCTGNRWTEEKLKERFKPEPPFWDKKDFAPKEHEAKIYNSLGDIKRYIVAMIKRDNDRIEGRIDE